ncbi:MAG: hypothetical protein NTW54_09800 [Bacteroidetes bacterium]|nr:hypothetical protein [Bacteroidota bacterium]
MRELVQLGYIKQILTEYNNDIPLHFHLKEFYKKHRQFGARDRRFYSEVVYKYFRCKTLFVKLPFETKLCYSGFLTCPKPTPFYNYLLSIQNMDTALLSTWDAPLEEKFEILRSTNMITMANAFPSISSLEEGIDKEQFVKSHLVQPNFFIRVPKNKVNLVLNILQERKVEFVNNGECFTFAAPIDISKLLPENSYEVQDYSSQQTIDLFQLEGQEKLWDCCSGAGGKSLMLMDRFTGVHLFCSDKRSNILNNLKDRFSNKQLSVSGVNVYDAVKKNEALIFDNTVIPDSFFDVILADVPCSGSGTWGRTPERLSQFKEEEIGVYGNLQTSIVKNAVKFLKTGGKLIYITCSVYAAENTEKVKSFEPLGLKIMKQNYFMGYDKNADTLFGAVLVKQ